MKRSGPIKLFGLLIAVIAVNVAVLSPGLLGVQISGGSALETASGITLLFISLLIVMYASYSLLFRRTAPAARPVIKVESPEDYMAELGRYRQIRVLRENIDLSLGQIDRIGKKLITLDNILSQRFQPEELSYRKFKGVIYEVEKLFYLNLRGILNKLSVFDESEYALFTGSSDSARFSGSLKQKKQALFAEYFSYISGSLGANEEILLKLDQLVLEIAQLNSNDYTTVDDMPCMKEITTLIEQTKLYQQ